jgi:hypothetical protein
VAASTSLTPDPTAARSPAPLFLPPLSPAAPSPTGRVGAGDAGRAQGERRRTS